MCLKIYTRKKDIPKGTRCEICNDRYFKGMELHNDEVTKKILKEIDNAYYYSSRAFIDRGKSPGAIDIDQLSTGCKTLLNIVYNPETCFSLIECGHNALEAALTILSQGIALWEYPSFIVTNIKECNVEIDGRKFTNTMQVARYFEHLMKEGYDDED